MQNANTFNYAKQLARVEALSSSTIKLDVMTSVKMSLDEPVSDKVFNQLCEVTEEVYDKVDKGYTQLIADVVVDLYQDCGYGYRNKKSKTIKDYFTGKEYKVSQLLTKKDLEDLSWQKREMIIEIFYDKYYDC